MNFHCTYCGHKIDAGDAAAGTQMKCSACEAEVSVPAHPQPVVAEATPAAPVASDGPATVPQSAGKSWGQTGKRMFLFTLLACLTLGASIAIFCLLASNFGETQLLLLLSTFSLGVYSMAGLCCAALADRDEYGWFGQIGVCVAAIGGLFAVVTNWNFHIFSPMFRLSCFVVSFAFAHASLLLLIDTNHGTVRKLRKVTLVVIAVVAVVMVLGTMNLSVLMAWPVIGSLVVVDVLGTIATTLVHFATREPKTA